MKDKNALAVANYFLEIAKESSETLEPLKLIKLVYIAHGFILALTKRSAFDPRFDKVEAWKYGPVIPSVYHSFKHYERNAIKEYTTMMLPTDDANVEMYRPMLCDKELCKICRVVYKRFAKFSGSQLVSFLHKKNTPWDLCYIEGENKEIPDKYTQYYFDGYIDWLIAKQRNERTSI